MQSLYFKRRRSNKKEYTCGSDDEYMCARRVEKCHERVFFFPSPSSVDICCFILKYGKRFRIVFGDMALPSHFPLSVSPKDLGAAGLSRLQRLKTWLKSMTIICVCVRVGFKTAWIRLRAANTSKSLSLTLYLCGRCFFSLSLFWYTFLVVSLTLTSRSELMSQSLGREKGSIAYSTMKRGSGKALVCLCWSAKWAGASAATSYQLCHQVYSTTTACWWYCKCDHQRANHILLGREASK